MRDGWTEFQLGDLCRLVKGTSPTQKTLPGEYPLIVTAAEPLTSDSYQIDDEAVCVPMVSSTGHGHASLKRLHYARGKFAVANIIVACIVKDRALCDTRYLWLYLQERKDEVLVPRMQGTANVSLSQRELAKVPVLLPSILQQRRIVDLIGALDEAIEAADGVSDACSTLLGSILDAHVSDGSLPLKDLASVKSGASWGAADGSSLPGEGFRPVLTIVNTRPGGAVELTERTYVRGLSERAATLTSDSLVMIRTNGNRGRIGNIYRTPAEVVGDSVSAFQFVIEPRDVHLRDYLYWVMQAPTRQSAISSAASGSTGLGNIAAGWLNEMNIPWSEHIEREVFIGICNAAGSAVESAIEYAASVRSTRTNLLTALLSGEHEIPSSYDKHLGAIA